MNVPMTHPNKIKTKVTCAKSHNDQSNQIAARLLEDASRNESMEPALRQLLEAAIAAASEAEHRVAEQEAEIERLRELSVTDEATGLLNRRGFTDAMRRALTRSERYGETGLLIIIDLDGFKSINDTHGHAAGDFVLQTVSNVLRQCVRQVDDVARIGGDEFAVLLNQTAPEPAMARSRIISTVLNDLVAP